MKRILIFAIGISLSVTIKSFAAELAQARLFCLSLRFQQGVDMAGFYTLDLTTLTSGFNGELAPSFSRPDHVSYFREYDTLLDEVIQEGQLAFNTPAFTDANNNGFDDFFEVSRPVVSQVSTGVYASAVDVGTIRVTWNRWGGSKDGTCVVRLTSNTLGSLGDFTHTFELMEYAGPLSFTPGTNSVTGTLDLTKTGDPTDQLIGPLEFVKSPTNRFNQLELQPGVLTLTNVAAQSLTNLDDPFDRDLSRPTNYFGYVDFDDGDPNTPDEPDYLTWILSIDDPNDSNGNGIPDFSDDPGSIGDRLPMMSLSLGNTNLLLSIRPGLGNVYEIQQINSLNQTNWTAVLSVTVTNDPQIVSLPLPTNSTGFWRLRQL